MNTILYIKGTELTPEIMVNIDGSIFITGKSVMDDPEMFYQPLLKMIWLFKVNIMVFDLKLEVINAESTKQILELFELAKANPWVDSLKVFWEYDPSCMDKYNYGNAFDSVLGPSSEYIKLDKMDFL